MAELFDRYAVDRVPRWPLMSRLVALSVVVHGLFFVAVIYVPSLRNLLRVAGSMSGIELVSEDYDRTLLGQRATIIKLEPHQKLYYPVDYFGAPADPALDPMLMTQAAPPPAPVIIRPPRQPRQRAQVIPTPTPSPEVAEVTPTPTPDETERKAADEEIDKIAQKYGVKRPSINTKPFEELAQKGKEMYEQGKVKMDSVVDVTATAERNDDGTFKPESVKINWVTTNDPVTAELAQMTVMAVSQSKVLSVLEGVKNVNMGLKLDQQKVSVRIANEFPSEAEAGKQAEGFASMILLARLAKSGTDEGELYKNVKINTEGRQLVMTFEMPKDAAGKMIVEMLARKAAKDKQKEKEAAGATPVSGKG